MVVAAATWTPTSGRFERLAHTVAERLAELFCARVCVIDDRHVCVADSEPAGGIPRESVRLPLEIDGCEGEVLIGRPRNGEVVSPRLAGEIAGMIVAGQLSTAGTRLTHHELKNKFIHDLLRGSIESEANVQREAELLGIDLTRPRSVILVDAADYMLSPGRPGDFYSGKIVEYATGGAPARSRADLVIDRIVGYFHLPNDTICGYIGEGEVAVLKASTSRDLEAWSAGAPQIDEPASSWADLPALKRASAGLLARLRRDTATSINIGIGRFHPGIRGMARSYDDARTALSLGKRFHGGNQVHSLDELGVAAFVGISDTRTKHDLACHLLSPLDHEPELLETLDVFFLENCCVSTTAARLSIHRNTLSYRFDKIASLSGLDPRRFDDAVQVRLALVLRTLHNKPDFCAPAQ